MTSEFAQRIKKEIVKEYGDDIFVGANALLETKKKIISVSPCVDMILGGGIPEGVWATITGKPKIGKTVLSLQFAKNWQAAGPRREVYYGNVEHRLKQMNINSCIGLDMDRFHIIQSSKDKILTAQDYLRIFENILRTQENVLLIVDSFALLSEEAEQVGGVGTQTRGGGNKLLAQFCRNTGSVVPVQKSVVLGITHLMSNTSGYGAGLIEKGGNAIWYQADVKLRAIEEKRWIVGDKETGPKIGKVVTWRCEVSALGPPDGEIQGYHRFGRGIDEIAEYIMVAKDLGLITTPTKGYYLLKFLEKYPDIIGEAKDIKIHGIDKTQEVLMQNQLWLNALNAEIKTILYGQAA